MAVRIAGFRAPAASQAARRVAIPPPRTESAPTMSGLTTHVLDTTHGKPAAGVALRLKRGEAVLVAARTNADGRCDSPLLSDEAMTPGAYRLEFDVGAYFRGLGMNLPEPAFLETVVIE